MPHKLLVPRADREALVWQLHASADGETETRVFAKKVAERAGFPRSERAALVAALVARLPARVDDVDMDAVVAILEDIGALVWIPDAHPVTDAQRQALAAAIEHALTVAPRGSMPSPVADVVLIEAGHVLGAALDSAARADVRPRLLSELEHSLWRRPGIERDLAERLVSVIVARVRRGR